MPWPIAIIIGAVIVYSTYRLISMSNWMGFKKAERAFWERIKEPRKEKWNPRKCRNGFHWVALYSDELNNGVVEGCWCERERMKKEREKKMSEPSNPTTDLIRHFWNLPDEDVKKLEQIVDKQWLLLKELLSRSKVSLEVPPEESKNGTITSQTIETAIRHFIKIAAIEGHKYGRSRLMPFSLLDTDPGGFQQ